MVSGQSRSRSSIGALLRATVAAFLGIVSSSVAQQPSSQPGEAKCLISALSLNLHGVRDSHAILTALREADGLERADVMLFQEVVRPSQARGSAVDDLARALGMHIAFASGFDHRNREQEGLAVLSRYPILESRVIPLQHNELFWKSRRRVALAVTLQTPAGPLRVYNLHLDTRVNLKARLTQLRPVAEEAAVAPGPVLVGGDLNTNPYRWVGHTLPILVAPDQGAGVLRYMKGLGYDSVFPRKTATSRWFGMQLDWIFVRHLDAGPAAVQPMFFSDHHALCACLHLASLPPSTSPLSN
jgi:endonuclease/exonuclease/phosphatase family metal-dependent hydrolase